VQTAPPAAGTGDIAVTGRRMERLKRLRITAKRDRRTGVTRCIFKRRSGDAALDTAVCDAVLACVPKAETVDAMRACVAPTMDALTAEPCLAGRCGGWSLIGGD
jgi:hypothetical protein